MKKIKFGYGLIALILILSCLPLAIMSTMSIVSVKKNVYSNFTSNAEQTASSAVIMLDNKIETYANKIDSMQEKGNYSDLEDLKKQLRLVSNDDESILNFYFVDSNTGAFIQILDDELPEGIEFRELDWYIETMQDPESYVVNNPYEDALTGKSTVTLYKAAVKDGTAMGVLAMDINLGELSEQMSALTFGETGEVTIADTDGGVISNTDVTKIGGNEPLEYSVWDEIINNDSGFFSLDFNEREYEGKYSTSELTGWKVIAKMDRSELDKSQNEQIKILVGVMIAVILFAVTIAVIMTKKINKPLGKITECIRKASQGDFSFKMDVITNIAEVQEVEDSLNEMSESISSLIRNVDENAININQNSIKAAQVSEDISESINQVGMTISEISQGTTKSADGLEEISSYMENLSKSMDEMKEISNKVNEMAVNAEKLGGQGVEVLSLVINKSEETKNSTLNVKEVVEEVSGSINKIKGINETIRGFTEQTNMLALNAAIEAARAGESGKGFAVVADQIRKLAEETAVQAKQIDEIVHEIDDRSKAAVNSVEDTADIVREQDKAVNETKGLFTEIMTSIQVLSKKVHNINDSLNSVNNMKDQVVVQVERLFSILQETASGTEEVTASAEEVSAATETFVSEFKDIKEMSDTLKDNVSKFKF